MTSRQGYLLFVCLLFLAGSGGGVSAQAQDPGGAKQKLQQAQKQNAAELRNYQWMTRTQLMMKGEVKNTKVENVYYNPDGTLNKTTVSSTPQQQQQGGGRLKQHMIQKKTEEFKELMQDLSQLAQSYSHLTPDQMQALAGSATLSQGQGEMQGTVHIQGTNVVVQGDTMNLWVDPSTFLFRQVQIASLYEQKPMNLAVQYQTLPTGPTYPAQTTLDYPDKKVEVLIENYNYQPLRPAPAAAKQQAAAAAPPAPPPATGGTLPLGTVVQALPAGCTSTPVGGVEYYYCGGNFYRPAYQGNQLVYVTVKP
jgi:hypothetical protein